MKKLRMYFLPACLLVSLILLVVPLKGVHAATDLADGTYTINYTVLHSDNDSASMANDYWEKPAKIIVDGGKMNMQMTINHSAWVTDFKVPNNGGYSDVSVISSDKAADKRVVQFPVDNLSSPLVSKIHVTVEDINYDHDYTVRFSFDTSSIQTVSLTEDVKTTVGDADANKDGNKAIEKKSSEMTKTNTTETVKNPQTSDTAMISLFVVLLFGSGVFLFKRFKVRGY
ncbi:heme uptake protein IsdC [Lederbergia lenta]|uniref:heme uptake protein IsdC n=1 Tax=Lederbergia lenta TaxID=1467 RepID=UPI00203FDBBC|nr:heme uptake protein IsdC [Lederbergia lenta]MCM3112713.1 heme uptake protein IsdC [Lederbergia lenta]